MKVILLSIAAIGALTLSGCMATQSVSVSTGNARLVAAANKIDAGAQLAIADLPSACQIVGQIATLANVYLASGLAGSAPTIAIAANGAAALAGSPLCQNPAMADPAAASIQIIGAVAAVKAATSGKVTAPAAAVSLPAGG